MRVKRLKSIKINSYRFSIEWDKKSGGGWFSFHKKKIKIGIEGNNEDVIFMILCHELMEICAIEMNVRLNRPDCDGDFIFVYDHRQYDTMINMFSALIALFV